MLVLVWYASQIYNFGKSRALVLHILMSRSGWSSGDQGLQCMLQNLLPEVYYSFKIIMSWDCMGTDLGQHSYFIELTVCHFLKQRTNFFYYQILMFPVDINLHIYLRIHFFSFVYIQIKIYICMYIDIDIYPYFI